MYQWPLVFDVAGCTPIVSSPPPFPSVPATVWCRHRHQRGCCADRDMVAWCGDVHVSHSKYFFFTASYFSLPLTHHMTLVEIKLNVFSHFQASLLMPPPTPTANGHHHCYLQHQRQGWRQGVQDVDGWTGGLEMHLHLEPQVSSYFSFFFLLY